MSVATRGRSPEPVRGRPPEPAADGPPEPGTGRPPEPAAEGPPEPGGGLPPASGVRRLSAFGVLTALVGVFLLYLAVPSVGPTLRAARADGVPGHFTAREVACVRHPGHESCTWTGEFRSGDGAVHRRGVTLYGSDRESLRPGQTTAAVDVGRPYRVYGPGGSREWVFTALLLAVGLGLLAHPFLRARRAAGVPAARSRPVPVPMPGQVSPEVPGQASREAPDPVPDADPVSDSVSSQVTPLVSRGVPRGE